MATSNFPSSLDTTSALPASISETANLNSPNHADMHEVYNDAIIEIEEKLGTGDTTASTGAVLIGTGSGASAWDTSPTFLGAVTVGVNDTGHDVKFFGATDGKYMEWDESADQLDVTGSLDVTGNTSMVGTVTVGSDGSGHDVVFYSGTAGDNITWDASEECLIITGTAGQLALDVAAGTVEFNGNFNVGTDGSGHDVRFYSATAGDHFHWDASDEKLVITGTAGQDALHVAAGDVNFDGALDVSGTTNLDVVDIDGAVNLTANLAFTGTLSGTSSIPRMAYTHASSTKATVASHQLDSNPSILICDTQPTASLNNGDIWFDIS